MEKKKTKKIVAKAWQTKQKKETFSFYFQIVKSLMLSFELRNEEEADEYTAWIFTSYNINIIQKIISSQFKIKIVLRNILANKQKLRTQTREIKEGLWFLIF